MADIRSEGDLNRLTIDEFVEHLRSPDPKTALDDQRAADEIESLMGKLDAAERRIDELVQSALDDEDKLHEAMARAYDSESRLDGYQRALEKIAHTSCPGDEICDCKTIIAAEALEAPVVERPLPNPLRFDDGPMCEHGINAGREPCPQCDPIGALKPVYGFPAESKAEAMRRKMQHSTPTFCKCSECGEEYPPGYDHACVSETRELEAGEALLRTLNDPEAMLRVADRACERQLETLRASEGQECEPLIPRHECAFCGKRFLTTEVHGHHEEARVSDRRGTKE